MLDEIDQLDSRKQSVLYTVFEWPSAPNSKLVLIGIANALDLTDRILPRLQARLDLRPQLLHFTPYTKLEIVNILTERLKQVNITLKIQYCKYCQFRKFVCNHCYCVYYMSIIMNMRSSKGLLLLLSNLKFLCTIFMHELNIFFLCVFVLAHI